MKIGLFFGSFNPVHTGHLIIANYVLQYTDLQKVWLVLTPQNPFKKKESLARDYERLHLLNLATDDSPNLIPSSIEFGLKRPSYTIDTLTFLTEKYPDHNFSVIMGGDNLYSLPKWKNGDIIIKNYPIYVYKRSTYELGELENHENVRIVDAPLLSISATMVRKMISEGKSVQYIVPDAVFRYLEGSNIYKI
ncbi:MAG: nicotinate (nicotinamide) nucleotide adenylyltransferase [Saprospiraceae bacterium]|nr:nicotinate (nicotinamide) nucleotide adenylyltransferase [Saprospiraceae bacterium]